MTDAPEPALNPAEQQARDAVRQLSRPRASAAFRARLKREFVGGTIGAPAWSAPARGAWGATWMVLAPAAAVMLVVLALVFNRGPDWDVVSVTGSGVAVVDGRPILLTHAEELELALRRGGKVRLSGGGTLELMAPGQMAIEIVSGSEATVPPVAGRWLGRKLEASVQSGEMRITTGRDFRGARLAVSTPEATLMVVGTTLAVIREDVGTCVCVMDGRVMMGPRNAAMAPIESGRRRFVFNDGRPPEEAEIRDAEKVALAEMRARHSSDLE